VPIVGSYVPVMRRFR